MICPKCPPNSPRSNLEMHSTDVPGEHNVKCNVCGHIWTHGSIPPPPEKPIQGMSISMGIKDGAIFMQFNHKVRGLAFDKPSAIQFAKDLQGMIDQL